MDALHDVYTIYGVCVHACALSLGHTLCVYVAQCTRHELVCTGLVGVQYGVRAYCVLPMVWFAYCVSWVVCWSCR